MKKKILTGVILTSALLMTACTSKNPTPKPTTGIPTTESPTTELPTTVPTTVPTDVPTTVPTTVPTDVPTTTPDVPTTSEVPTKPEVTLPEKYKEIVNSGYCIINNDFNSYSATDKLANFSSWGTSGFYQYLNVKNADGNSTTNYVDLSEGYAKSIDTSGDGTQIVIDYGQTMTDGTIEGYYEATTVAAGNSWTFMQFYGTSQTKTEISEVFGIRADAGVLKYRLDGGSPVSALNDISVTDTTYKVHFVINLDNNTITVTINDQPFVTDLAVSLTSIAGHKLVTSDAGSKLVHLDNFAVSYENVDVATYKANALAQLETEYNSYDATKYASIAEELQSVYLTAKASINASTDKGEISSFITEAFADFAIYVYTYDLENCVDKSLYVENATALASAISAGKNNIKSAKSKSEAASAYNAAVLQVKAVKTDAQLLDDAKKSAIEEISNYKDSALYAESINEYNQIINNAKTTINNANSIALIEYAVDNAKTQLDALKTDAQLLEVAKQELITQLEAKKNLLVNELNGVSASAVEEINQIFLTAKNSINSAANFANANIAFDAAYVEMQSVYEYAMLSLDEYIVYAKGELSTYAQAKIVKYPDHSTQITSILNQQLTIISSSTTKDNVKTNLTASIAAIDDYIKQNIVEFNVTLAKGDMESAYVEFEILEDADSYNVYYKGKNEGEDKYVKIDDMLIRKYPDTMRADVVGLAAGNYSIKVAAVANGEEYVSVVNDVEVLSYDRSGFAFSSQSPIGDASGAYNANGTLKSGAQVVYVTKDNAKTCTAIVNGTTVAGFQSILDAKQKKGTSGDIICFRIIGTVSKSDLDHISSSSEGLQIKGAAAQTNMNITIEGIGEDATINGFGMLIRNCANVEVRNIGVINFMDDGISVDTDNCNLWLHDNDFFYGNAGGDADQAKGDGSLDVKKSQYITISYNHFWDSGKCNLLDASVGTASNYMTYHHNWFDHSDSRHPRVRNANSVHVYNNYYDGVAKYGIGAAGGGSSVFSEANYFRNTAYPMLISKQGSDIATDDKGTFSGEDGGIIKSYGDVIVGGTFRPYSSSNSVEFDAYVASARDEVVSNTIKSKQGGHTYSNFDTAATMYTYTAQTAEEAKNTVEMYAGRINGGDLQYDFNDAVEDTNYDIISEFKSMVVNYKTTLVSIQGASSSGTGTGGSTDSGNTGGSTGGDSDNTGGNTGNEGTPEVTGAHTYNWTTTDGNSSIFSVTGNTSTSKGTATYNGASYTKCLKMESATNISFTTTSEMTLTLVFGPTEGGKGVKIDGTKTTVGSDGTLTITLSAGSHTITKGDSINLFLILLN